MVRGSLPERPCFTLFNWLHGPQQRAGEVQRERVKARRTQREWHSKRRNVRHARDGRAEEEIRSQLVQKLTDLIA